RARPERAPGGGPGPPGGPPDQPPPAEGPPGGRGRRAGPPHRTAATTTPIGGSFTEPARRRGGARALPRPLPAHRCAVDMPARVVVHVDVFTLTLDDPETVAKTADQPCGTWLHADAGDALVNPTTRPRARAPNRRRVRRWISRTTCSVLAPLPIRLLLPVGPGVSLSSTLYVVHNALTANTHYSGLRRAADPRPSHRAARAGPASRSWRS